MDAQKAIAAVAGPTHRLFYVDTDAGGKGEVEYAAVDPDYFDTDHDGDWDGPCPTLAVYPDNTVVIQTWTETDDGDAKCTYEWTYVVESDSDVDIVMSEWARVLAL